MNDHRKARDQITKNHREEKGRSTGITEMGWGHPESERRGKGDHPDRKEIRDHLSIQEGSRAQSHLCSAHGYYPPIVSDPQGQAEGP